jgi:hypothetical protein
MTSIRAVDSTHAGQTFTFHNAVNYSAGWLENAIRQRMPVSLGGNLNDGMGRGIASPPTTTSRTGE